LETDTDEPITSDSDNNTDTDNLAMYFFHILFNIIVYSE